MDNWKPFYPTLCLLELLAIDNLGAFFNRNVPDETLFRKLMGSFTLDYHFMHKNR